MTLHIAIPGRGSLALDHLVLDVNGTIAEDGALIPGVATALQRAAEDLRVVAITADQHGNADRLREELGIDIHVVSGGEEESQKLAFVEELGVDAVVAIGNGANDAAMLAASAVGICVVGPEGAATTAVSSADVVVRSIGDAIELIARPRRLVATLRR